MKDAEMHGVLKRHGLEPGWTQDGSRIVQLSPGGNFVTMTVERLVGALLKLEADAVLIQHVSIDSMPPELWRAMSAEQRDAWYDGWRKRGSVSAVCGSCGYPTASGGARCGSCG